ncbi:hypothetical protein [Acinetobacter sp.]|uniref:hypothetical protein n=1 Tax=Acinetobacter sp. TaxID=472 RepID=UPI002897B36B|nr:hypothetical protein [Acinetobacter sp.]
MWEYLVCLSTLIEDNSGQIQIILGILAIYLAVNAYRKALHQTQLGLLSIQKAQEQLDHSLVQAELNQQNRFIDNKNTILTLLVELIDRAKEGLSEVSEIDAQLLVSRVEKIKNSYPEYSKYSEKYVKYEADLKKISEMLDFIHKSCLSDFEEVSKITFDNSYALESWQPKIMNKKIWLINSESATSKMKHQILLILNPID